MIWRSVRVQLQPPARALMECLTQYLAGGEAEYQRYLASEPSLEVGPRVQQICHAATREPVVPDRRVFATELLDPLIGSDVWLGGRHLDRSSGVAGGGQPRHDHAGTRPVVVKGDDRPAVVDSDLGKHPTGQRSADAGHQRGRRYRLGDQRQRLQMAAAEVVDLQRCRDSVLIGEDDLGVQVGQDQQGHDSRADSAAASGPALDPDRLVRVREQPDELGVQVTSPCQQQLA